MRSKDVAIFAVCVLSILILASPAQAQTSLVSNVARTNEHLWGGDTATYAASLTEGHWNVIVSSDAFWGLKVRIIVADNASFTSIIAESGTGTGNYPEVGFTLESDQTVYIRVEENSVYGDSHGYYDIGVYDDDVAFQMRIGSFFWNNIIIFSIGIPLLFMCCCFALARRGRGPAAQQMLRRRSFTVDAPSFAIPEEHKGISRSDGSEIRTVRVPKACPNCGGALSQENLDWTGPLEARCNYCGAVIQATFERI